MANKKHLTDEEREAAINHCPLLQDGSYEAWFGPRLSTKAALDVHNRCIEQLKKLEKRKTPAPKPVPASRLRSETAFYRELITKEKSLNQRDKDISAQEREANLYNIRVSTALTQLTDVQNQVQGLQVEKKGLETDIENLQKGFVDSINPEHLIQVNVWLLYHALVNQLWKIIETNQATSRFFSIVSKNLHTVLKAYDEISDRQKRIARQR